MEENITIENWWTDLQKQYRNYMGSGYDFIGHVDKTIIRSGETEKKETINFLTRIAIKQENRYEVALAVLQKHCTPDNLELLFEKAKTFKLGDHKIIDYLKVIGHKGKQAHRQLLEDFLLSKKLNANHSFVQWSTYPNYPDIFVKAYSKYLIETDYREWTGSGIVQSFMDTPRALELLKDFLEVENNDVWRKFRNDLQTELTKDFWDKRNKTEIGRIISATNNSLPKGGYKWWKRFFSN